MLSASLSKRLGFLFKITLCPVLLSVMVCANQAHAAMQVRIAESPISRQIHQPTITAIFSDRDGFLWIGTQHGLYKFDGANVTEFSSNRTGHQNIAATDIKGIIADSTGRITIAAFGGGILEWNYSKKSFQSIKKATDESHMYATDLVSSIDGRVWFGAAGNLYSYVPQSSQEIGPLIAHTLDNNEQSVSAIATDEHGSIYVAMKNKLYRISEYSLSAELVFEGTDPIQITTICFGNRGLLYIGTESGEILSLRASDGSIESRIQLGKNSTISILALLFYKDLLWIGTNNGLSYSDSELSSIDTYTQDNSGLTDNHVLTLAAEENFMWIGTYRGLNTLTFVPFELFNSQNSGVFNDVLAFEEDDDNHIWVGTFNGLYRLEEQRSGHTQYKDVSTKQEVSDQRVMTLARRDGELWLGLQQNGLRVIDTENFSTFSPDIPGLDSLEVTKILHTDDNRTWIATYNQGLYLFEDGKATSYLASGMLPEPSITVLIELNNGDLLASSEQKIYALNEKTGRFLPINIDFKDSTRPPFILSISQNNNEDVWIGTKDQGLFIWRKEAQLIDSPLLFKVGNGRPDSPSTVYEIQFDDDGNAWCSTQDGLVKLDSRGNISATFNSTDGLQGSDFNFGAAFRDSRGRIYFGGSSGYNRFMPRDVRVNGNPPGLSLTKIGISRNSSIDYFDASELHNLQLTHNDYFVQFNFSVLDFLDPEKNQYRYMLEGFDPDWLDNGTRNTATYTSLPPGDYIFRVQGANSAGVWNRDGISLAIEVLPPPWLTWWAFTGYALVLMFLLWLGTRAYVSFVIQRVAKQMAVRMVEAEERADDEMQEQLEIHDDLVKSVYMHSVSTLNLVSECLAIKGSSLADTDAQASTDSSVKRVLALATLEDCLYYQNEILLADLNKYTDVILHDLLKESPVGEESIITINEVMTKPFPIEQASVLAIALYELLENSVQHAFEDSPGANYLHITLAAEQSEQPKIRYRLTVQDNGLGIPPNIDTSEAQTPGLMIVAAMTKRLSGVLTFTVKNGTIATITFPGRADS